MLIGRLHGVFILKSNLSYRTYTCILTYILGVGAQKFMSMLFLLILLCVLYTGIYIGYNIIKKYIYLSKNITKNNIDILPFKLLNNLLI